MLTCISDHVSTRLVDMIPMAVANSLSDINHLVMDYLITNGYPAAANKFAVEANIQPKADADTIQARVEIRTAIHSGNIQSAIERINELNPQVRFTLSAPPCYDYTRFMHHS